MVNVPYIYIYIFHVYTYMGCFHVLANVNSAAMHFGMHFPNILKSKL